MRGEYRFMRTHGQTTRYAVVRLVSEEAPDWQITFASLPSRQVERHGEEIRTGVDLAIAAFMSRGGRPQHVHVDYLEESIVDTTPDAVICAAALAAWKAFGRSDSSARVEMSAGNWNVSFL